MFSWLKSDPLQKMQKEYESLMTQAVEAQRNGKIELYGELSLKADQLLKKIDEARNCTTK
jgi:uncharacterized protein YaaW (UPF0174 family)